MRDKRNSTINLASLVPTVTNRFSYSASVGNLWNHGQHQSNQNELADDVATDGIRPIDYIASGTFDSYQPDDNDNKLLAKEPKSIKSASCHKLLGVASMGPTRKLSTKEKCKRQKDAERVEKLRLLVSYLRSGSSQPIVNPVALEADEIELAERYKLHMILRDDFLRDAQASDQQQNQIPSISETGASDNWTEHKQSGNDNVGKGRLISHSVGGTTASSPASSYSGSMNHAHSTNEGRSIPHIGNVTWVLRHSISDPGNNFQHSPAFSSSSSSHHHLMHDNQDLCQLHNNHNNNNNNGSNNNSNDERDDDVNRAHPYSRSAAHNLSDCVNCESCAPSSSYSGSSLNNYCSVPAINRDTLKQQTSSSNQKSPKLFYIDDTDHIPTSAQNGPIPALATPTISSINQPSSSYALCSASSTCCSQPVTPAISTTSSSGGYIRNSSCASTSAWSNAPNLATWIDNEVNSIVHDLEAKSNQLSSKSESEHTKSGKKKWLSVTTGNPRRNSSGAQST